MEEVIDSIIATAERNGGHASLGAVLAPMGDFYMETFDNRVQIKVANESLEGITDIEVRLQKVPSKFSAEVSDVLFTFDFGYTYDTDRKTQNGVSLSMETDDDGCDRLHIALN